MKKIGYLIFIIAGVLILASSCEEVDKKFDTEDDLISIADYLYEHEDEYASFIKIMEAGGLVDALSSYNPNGRNYTLFLPTNESIDAYIAGNENYSSLDALLSDTDFVRALSRYHVVNRGIATNDFPLGALPDSCLTGDLLIIAYIQGEDSTYYMINSQALVEKEDLPMTNGIIHVIDNMLEPITLSGYDWLKNNPDYSIITELIELTGLVDTLGIFITGWDGRVLDNTYSLIVEADSIYAKDGYLDVDDVIEKLGNGNTEYTSDENPIYQFTAYHILAQSRFLADLYDGTNNYNTYASLPVQITSGIEIRINTGVSNFDSIFSPADSSYTYIDYLILDVNSSNVQTRNGPIHFVDHVMELFQPKLTRRTFQFYEEPLINSIRNDERRYIFIDNEPFTKIKWYGTEEMAWEKSSSSSESASNRDYIEIDGDFEITYKIPKILPGKYGVQIRVDTQRGRDNATIQVYLDGNKVGGNLNLTTGGLNSNNPYRMKNMGIVEFGKYTEHTVTIRSLIPGRFVWDWIRFENNLKTYGNNRQ